MLLPKWNTVLLKKKKSAQINTRALATRDAEMNDLNVSRRETRFRLLKLLRTVWSQSVSTAARLAGYHQGVCTGPWRKRLMPASGGLSCEKERGRQEVMDTWCCPKDSQAAWSTCGVMKKMCLSPRDAGTHTHTHLFNPGARTAGGAGRLRPACHP